MLDFSIFSLSLSISITLMAHIKSLFEYGSVSLSKMIVESMIEVSENVVYVKHDNRVKHNSGGDL